MTLRFFAAKPLPRCSEVLNPKGIRELQGWVPRNQIFGKALIEIFAISMG